MPDLDDVLRMIDEEIAWYRDAITDNGDVQMRLYDSGFLRGAEHMREKVRHMQIAPASMDRSTE